MQFLPGIGPNRALAFERLGLVTLEHLVRHVPRDWLDARRFVKVAEARPGGLVTVVGEIRHASAIRTRGGRTDFVATVADGSALLGLYFFGQSWLARTLTPGTRVVVSGEVEVGPERRMQNPMFEVLEGDIEDLLHAGRLVPVHPLTRGVTARLMRTAVRHALDAVADAMPDLLPPEVAQAQGFGPLGQALRDLHFPADGEALERARRRLAFEELFQLQMVMELRRRALREEGRSLALAPPDGLVARVRSALPFSPPPGPDATVRGILKASL
ncbi:MAG: OB-fold nucleic acid binding domain-containing protein, partial [bacterium]